ncbi:hypothetical protein CCR75_002097 [Bremia lactucae]|uniref:Myb-like domain-containing protein n=1 Tax=Bremia lactucae TaxID=4779 RepID=A0A976FN20_BRELC|nr:hypothetical protein CCR75_002097 [Bremia lactucae]
MQTNKHANRAVGVWSSDEHDRFLEALKNFPQGPWKTITACVGTRSVRQVQTHAQKYQEKVSRRLHGLQTGKATRLRREHRIDHDILGLHTLISSPSNVSYNCFNTTQVQLLNNSPAIERLSFSSTPPIKASSSEHCVHTNSDGASPSSTSSLFLFENPMFALMETDDLPSLSESLDFFIETLI